MGKFLFFGVCLDSNDPKRAGRIRAVLDEDRGEAHTAFAESMRRKAANLRESRRRQNRRIRRR